jgi:hypothetical protein
MIVFMVALLSLFILVGGAVAGQKYLITKSSQIKPGSIGLYNLSKNARAALKGQNGKAGLNGKDGAVGATGAKGATGATGAAGAQGVAGVAGASAPTPTYGIASVQVARGSGPAATWAVYSTSLGSPVGDTAGGTFRFTCSTVQAPCKVSLAASTTDPGAVALYPRMVLTREDYNNGGPMVNCEYGDGTDNNGGTAALGNSPSAVTLGIGGSLDCGAGQAYPANGIASEIDVPAGYYNVTTTLTFKK